MIAVVGTLVGLVGLGAAVTAVGRIVYQRQMATEIDALLSDARPAAPSDVSERDLIVPEPVRRWLRYSQVVGRERPTTVRLRQKGQFQMDRTGGCRTRPSSISLLIRPGFSGRLHSGCCRWSQ
jgi:Family of unknown function (DUF6544)